MITSFHIERTSTIIITDFGVGDTHQPLKQARVKTSTKQQQVKPSPATQDNDTTIASGSVILLGLPLVLEAVLYMTFHLAFLMKQTTAQANGKDLPEFTSMVFDTIGGKCFTWVFLTLVLITNVYLVARIIRTHGHDSILRSAKLEHWA